MDHIPEEFDRGQCDGETAIAAGAPRLFWQTRGRWGELFTRLMSKRFGVLVQHISDLTTSREVSYRDGYNEATKAHVEEKFGAGSFQAVLDEVDEYRKQSYQTYLQQKKSGPA
jgi:hypothetical protein